MVLGVGLVARVPGELLGEDDLAAPERRDLEVARAEVEADAVSVRVVLHDDAALLRARNLRERDDLRDERSRVEVGEEADVERAGALLRVGLRDGPHDRVGAGDAQAPAAGAPEDELGDALDEAAHLRKRLRGDAGGQRDVEAVDVAVLALPGEGDLLLRAARGGAQVVQGGEGGLERGEVHCRLGCWWTKTGGSLAQRVGDCKRRMGS